MLKKSSLVTGGGSDQTTKKSGNQVKTKKVSFGDQNQREYKVLLGEDGRMKSIKSLSKLPEKNPEEKLAELKKLEKSIQDNGEEITLDTWKLNNLINKTDENAPQGRKIKRLAVLSKAIVKHVSVQIDKKIEALIAGFKQRPETANPKMLQAFIGEVNNVLAENGYELNPSSSTLSFRSLISEKEGTVDLDKFTDRAIDKVVHQAKNYALNDVINALAGAIESVKDSSEKEIVEMRNLIIRYAKSEGMQVQMQKQAKSA